MFFKVFILILETLKLIEIKELRGHEMKKIQINYNNKFLCTFVKDKRGIYFYINIYMSYKIQISEMVG